VARKPNDHGTRNHSSNDFGYGGRTVHSRGEGREDTQCCTQTPKEESSLHQPSASSRWSLILALILQAQLRRNRSLFGYVTDLDRTDLSKLQRDEKGPSLKGGRDSIRGSADVTEVLGVIDWLAGSPASMSAFDAFLSQYIFRSTSGCVLDWFARILLCDFQMGGWPHHHGAIYTFLEALPP